jgi:tetratricopeptide (TPR) repeat protein
VVVAGRAGIVRPREDARSAHAICVARAFEVDRSADGDIAELWVRVRDRTDDPLAAGWIAAARASEAARAGDLGASVAYRQAAVDAFDQLGDRRTACLHRVNAGHTATMLGEYERAEETLRTARRDADRMGLAQIGAFALHNLGLVVARLGNPERGLSLERDALAEGEAMKNVALQAVCHLYLAEILLGVDRAEESLSHARTATALFEHAPSVRVLALAVRARAEARLGHVEAALESSDEAMALLAEHGADESAALVYVCRMEALDAAGRPDEAVEVAKAGFAMVERATANISDRVARARVLDRVPEHAALAARLA